MDNIIFEEDREDDREGDDRKEDTQRDDQNLELGHGDDQRLPFVYTKTNYNHVSTVQAKQRCCWTSTQHCLSIFLKSARKVIKRNSYLRMKKLKTDELLMKALE